MKKTLIVFTLLMVFLIITAEDCSDNTTPPVSDSGVTKTTTKVTTGSDGLTAEQRHIVERYKIDNLPGAIKHLYIISPYSGQVILYSTVKEKVTSSGKRLSPETIVVGSSGEYKRSGFNFNDNVTNEVLQDDGTYGHSGDYLYWWDSKGIYHQHYLTGGQIVHISSEPLVVKSVVINTETRKSE